MSGRVHRMCTGSAHTKPNEIALGGRQGPSPRSQRVGRTTAHWIERMVWSETPLEPRLRAGSNPAPGTVL